MAAAKLALPLLRSATGWWWFWPFAMLWAWLAYWDPRTELGFATSAGGCILLIIGCALGINLKRCRNRSLAGVLPCFQTQSLLASGGLLIVLAIVLAAPDGWRGESVLALVTAAALGLGAGLSFPASWILTLALLGLIVWPHITGLGLADVWASMWSPWLAGLWLALGLLLFRKAGLSGQRLVGAYGWQGTRWTRYKWPGHQPHRMGRLLNPWPTFAQFMLTNTALLLWVGYLISQTSSGLSAEWLPLVSGVFVLIAGTGIFAMLGLLLGPGRQSLRQLAVLPGWSRSRLLLHAERSAWRSCLILVSVLAPMLLVSVWAGAFNIKQWVTAAAFLAGFMTVGIYAALWIMREPNAFTRFVVMAVAFSPVLMVAWAFFIQEGSTQATRPTALIVVLALCALLAWWLRRSARAAWTSISFGRDA